MASQREAVKSLAEILKHQLSKLTDYVSLLNMDYICHHHSMLPLWIFIFRAVFSSTMKSKQGQVFALEVGLCICSYMGSVSPQDQALRADSTHLCRVQYPGRILDVYPMVSAALSWSINLSRFPGRSCFCVCYKLYSLLVRIITPLRRLRSSFIFLSLQIEVLGGCSGGRCSSL